MHILIAAYATIILFSTCGSKSCYMPRGQQWAYFLQSDNLSYQRKIGPKRFHKPLMPNMHSLCFFDPQNRFESKSAMTHCEYSFTPVFCWTAVTWQDGASACHVCECIGFLCSSHSVRSDLNVYMLSL